VVEDRVVADGVVAILTVVEDSDVGDRVVCDAVLVVVNSDGSTQPYWQPLATRQLC